MTYMCRAALFEVRDDPRYRGPSRAADQAMLALLIQRLHAGIEGSSDGALTTVAAGLEVDPQP